MTIKRIGIALWIVGVLPGWAQDGPRGHWSGTVEIPNQPLAVEVDLDKGPHGWIGSISIPAQHVSGVPLDAIALTNGKWTFRMKGAPGDPTFTGSLSADVKTMSGDFTQGPDSAPFKLSRTGDPKVEEVKPNPAVAKEFVGAWEGTLEGPGLRLVLKISNGADGAEATLVSLDQGGIEIPASSIEQKDTNLTIAMKMVGAQYAAEINTEGSELNGTLTQNGNDLTLKLKKTLVQDKKP
jgi:hypothetical protein